MLPQSNPPSHVTGYCNNIVLPKPKVFVADEPSVSIASVGTAPRRGSTGQQQSSSALTKQPSNRGSASSEKTKLKLEKSPSKLDSQKEISGENDVPKMIRSPSQKPNKQISSPALTSAVSSKKIVPR